MPILARHFPKYWRILVIYQREAREAKRASRALRKQHLRDELRLAENAYRRGDQKGLFEVMRRLAPKQRKVKIQLRGDDGRILSNAEELSVFTEYCRGLFSQGQCVATSNLLGQPFRLEAVALEQHMRKLSVYKSVPAHTLPPAVWKLCRQALAPLLVQFTDKAWQLRPSAPSLWCDSWLVWLNKVGKQGRSPDELRPIALQDTGGKIVSKHLASLLRPSVVQALREYPQFAYYPGRCLASALARVTAHCDRIRHLLKEHRSDLYSRRLGKKALPCYGGLMLALDLSKAFDRVSRSDLDLAMRKAKVDDDLRVIILQWHDSVHYHLRVHTHQDSVHCTTGVRQGCCLAPYLWALLSCSMLTQIAERTDSKWVQFLLNAYADDVHEAWEVTSLDDLRWFERCVVATFAVLKSFRMIINEGGEICLPLAKRMTYLGAVLSYEGYCRRAAEYLRVTQTEDVVRPQDGAPPEAVVSGRGGLKPSWDGPSLPLARRAQVKSACLRDGW
ncbi:X-element\ORF2, partial [Symbiodinium microadriaticum]